MSAAHEDDMTEAGTTDSLREAFAQNGGALRYAGWINGVLMVLMALVGLFILSRAEDAGITILGLVLFVIGLANIFRLIHIATASHPQH
ncbi:MAG: hypothetical protein AAFY56_05165 [Pseudomonadota bacterium]